MTSKWLGTLPQALCMNLIGMQGRATQEAWLINDTSNVDFGVPLATTLATFADLRLGFACSCMRQRSSTLHRLEKQGQE